MVSYHALCYLREMSPSSVMSSRSTLNIWSISDASVARLCQARVLDSLRQRRRSFKATYTHVYCYTPPALSYSDPSDRIMAVITCIGGPISQEIGQRGAVMLACRGDVINFGVRESSKRQPCCLHYFSCACWCEACTCNTSLYCMLGACPEQEIPCIPDSMWVV